MFKVEARNSFGYSAYSDELTVLSGFTPYKPDAPTTSVSGSHVVVEWTAPASNGAPLEGYTIVIRSSDFETYYEELTDCDGSTNTIFTNTACSISLTSLTVSPYSLLRG
jgi:hypothetical protein